MSELHLFVIWEKARYQQERILADIETHFTILKQYDVLWDSDKIALNFSKFYGAKLADVNEKVHLCGGGEFRLIVVRDEKPLYELRETSKGLEIVNVNMFDAKMRYRSWTDGGHQIHATNSIEEMRHDYIMLIGERIENVDKFGNLDVEFIHRNVMGVDPWKSIEQLFDVLNETTTYVMLRGQKQIWNSSFPKEHRDVDILVPDNTYDNLVMIIGGVPDCNPDRPHQRIEISGETYYIDIWRTMHNYFDSKWEKKMLSRRQNKQGLVVLSDEDNFYSLLYHCVVTKGYMSMDYAAELQDYAGEVVSMELAALRLVKFMQEKRYEIVKPKHDDSICLHLEQEIVRKYAIRHGEYLQESLLEEDDLYCTCKVFKKENSFVKLGTSWLIDNEIQKLQLLAGIERYPQIINIGMEGEDKYVEISKVPGIDALKFFQDKDHYRPAIVKRFAMDLISILLDFSEHQLIHRDFIPQNLLVSEDGSVHVVDFGWAINYDEIGKCPQPKYLAHTNEGLFRAQDGCCDYYAMGTLLRLVSGGKIQYLNHIAHVAQGVRQSHYLDIQNLYIVQLQLKELADMRMSIKDRFELFLLRHRSIAKYYHKFTNKIKRIL